MKEADEHGLKLQQSLHQDAHHPCPWPCKTWAEFPALLIFLMRLIISAVFFLRTQACKCVAKGWSQLCFMRCLCPIFQGSKAWPRDSRVVCRQPSATLVHPLGSAGPSRPHTWSSIGLGTGLCQARSAGGRSTAAGTSPLACGECGSHYQVLWLPVPHLQPLHPSPR